METELNERAKQAFENARKKFSFSDVEFRKAIPLPHLIILACTGRIGSIIGKKGVIIGEIGKELKSKVRAVEYSKDEKKVIADICGNARVLGINEVFAPEGRRLKIIINTHDREKLTTQKDALEKAIEELTGTKSEIAWS